MSDPELAEVPRLVAPVPLPVVPLPDDVAESVALPPVVVVGSLPAENPASPALPTEQAAANSRKSAVDMDS